MANKRSKYSTWAKNFGQSVRFGSKEVLSEIAPNLGETIGSLPEDMRELRQDLRRLRANKRQVVNYLLGEEEQFSKYIQIGAKNINSSRKTGKFIDPKREEKLTMAAMGMDDLDFNFDDNAGLDSNDLGGASFEDIDMGPAKVVNMMGPSTKAMGAIAEGVAGTTTAVREGFESMNRANKNTFTMSEALQKHFHNESMAKFDAINSNLAGIVQFNNESMSTFVQASMSFYDKNLELMASINDALLRLSPVPKTRKEVARTESPVDAFMSGGFSLRGYAEMVAKNTKKSFQNSLIGGMLPMLNQEMILADFAANPLGMLLKGGISWMLGDKFNKSLNNMDKSFGNFIPALLTKLGHYDGKSEFVKTLSEIFGIKTTVSNRRFNQGDYEHGPIPFDGEAKIAITRVIPGYLSRQTALLEIIATRMRNGLNENQLQAAMRERAIDFKYSSEGSAAGSFIKHKDLRKIQKREERDLITRSYSDSRYAMRDIVSKLKTGNNIDRSSDIDNYIIGMTYSNEEQHPGDIDQIKRFIWIGANDGKSPSGSEYRDGISDDSANAIKDILEYMKVHDKSTAIGMYGAERHQARVNLSNHYKFRASDTEHGSGTHLTLSQINKGSAIDLYEDTTNIDWKYEKYGLSVDEFGKYHITKEGLEKFNKDYPKYHSTNPEYIYKYLKKQEESTVNNGTEKGPKIVEKGLTDKIREIIQAPFDKMASVFDAINTKMYEIIFGKDGMGGNLEELILGKKDEKTKRYTGGWFSEAINGVKDTYESTKSYLFGGKDKSGKPVEGVLSNIPSRFVNFMDKYFFGDEEGINPDGSPKKRKSVVDTIQSTLVDGFGDLAAVLFGNGNGGDESQRKKSLVQAKEAFNKAIPDIGKGAGMGAILGTVSGFGGFGLLGSLFLPGGPIGGALVGGAMGLLTQSKDFREMLFGKEGTDEQGNPTRIGGLISSDIINWFKKKKTAILGGSAMGVISTISGHGIAFGLMPSIAVGAFGPVIAGAAWGLVSHSERFRSMIFGTAVKDESGKVIKRVGGIINTNMMGKFKTALPRGVAGAISGMVGMGVLSQLGLVGSMIATGPIPAAILGAGFGIATASKDFTQRMFGYQDEHGKYQSGALDRMKNFFTVEVFEPLKMRMKEEMFAASMYIRKNILRPIRRAIFPIKELVIDIGATIKDALGGIFEPIKHGFHNIFVVMTDAIKAIMKPMIKVVGSISSWLFKRFKTVMKISIQTALLPLRMMGGLARMLVYGKDYKSGVKTAVGGVVNAIKTGSGVLGAIGGLGKAVFNPETRLKAANEEDQRLKEEDEKYELEQNAVLQAERKKMIAFREKIRAGGYNLTEDQIKEKLKAGEKKAAAEAKVVENAAKSGDPMQQMTAKVIEQGATAEMQREEQKAVLVEIRDDQRKQTKATTGVDIDNNATETANRKKAEQKAAEREEREKQDSEHIANIDADTDALKNPKTDKKSWFSKLFDGISGIAKGVFKFASIGAGILGVLGGISSIISFAFGGDDTRKKMVDSEAAGNLATRFGRGIARKIPKIVQGAGELAWGTTKYVGKSIKGVASNIFNKITGRGVEGAVQSAEANKGFIANIMERLNTTIDDIMKSNLFKRLVGEKAADGKVVHKGLIGFIKAIPKTIASLMRKNKASHLILIGLKKSKLAVAKGVAKTIAGGLTGGMLTAAFGAYDLASGASRAGFYFDVADEDVDERMRLVSGLINMLFGLPGMFVFDVSMSLVSMGAIGLSGTPIGEMLHDYGLDLDNMDYRKVFAQLIYRMTSDEGDINKLEADQKKLIEEYKAYLDKEGKTQDQMSLEQYQSEVKGQGGIWKNFGAPIINRILGIDKQPKSFMELVEDKFNGLVDWFKKAVDDVMNFNLLDWIKDKLFDITIGNRKDELSKWASKSTIDLDDDFAADGNGYYSQNDARWKNLYFDGGKFGDKGCAPTSLAMIAGIDPRRAAAMAQFGDFAGSGVKPSYFRHAAGQLGLAYRENRNPKDIYMALRTGTPTIMGGMSSNPNSPFYGNGHYVVANGMNVDGSVNILNPSGSSKNRSIGFNQLINESIGSGGYSGSFAGSGPKGSTVSPTEAKLIKKGQEDAKKLAKLSDAALVKKLETSGIVDEETAALQDAQTGTSAKSNGITETKSKDTATGKEEDKFKSGGDKDIGFMELVTGFGMGLKNLFGSIWGNSKYQDVTIDDLKGGLKALFGVGAAAISGPVQAKLLQAAKSFLNKGIKYSQRNPDRLDPDKSGVTDCSGLTAAIYKKAFGRSMLTPYGGEFDDPNRAGQWNESTPIDESQAQVGDLVFWETQKGVPDNHVGMVIDPTKHMAIASNTSTGPAEFQWDNSYWKPMFSGIRRPKVLAEFAKQHGGKIDISKEHMDTKKAVWNYLVNGLNIGRAGAAGIMGNIEQESHFDTAAIGDSGSSGGLVQWHDESPGAGRFTNLKNYANSIGMSWDDVHAQLRYLSHELRDPYYAGMYNFISKTKSVDDAVTRWVNDFERPADKPGEIRRRTPIADAYYKDTANFVGGANGFMNGSSGNILGNVIAGGLFDWGNRYRERGIAKQQMANAMAQYAASQGRPQMRNPQIVNVANTRVLPSKIDTGGASMDDLLLSIRALDNHGELREIIAYLATIAKNGGVGGNNIPIDDKTATQIRREIEQVKRSVSESKVPHRLNQAGMRNFNNAMDSIDGMPSNMLQLAKSIAYGGKFRTS